MCIIVTLLLDMWTKYFQSSLTLLIFVSKVVNCLETPCCPKNSTTKSLETMYGAEENEFPHMVSVSSGSLSSCGGTIYNSRYILTAAHCVFDRLTEAAMISFEVDVTLGRLGSNFVQYDFDGDVEESSTFEVEEIVIHENFSFLAGHDEITHPLGWRRTYNDIALLRLKRNIPFGENIKALQIPPETFQELDYAQEAVVVGWGPIENLTEGLHKANFPIRRREMCFSEKGAWPLYEALRDQLICMGGIVDDTYGHGRSTNSGDSGGPAIIM